MIALKVGLGWSLAIVFVALWSEIAALLVSKHEPRVRSRFWNLTFLLCLSIPLMFWLPGPRLGDASGDFTQMFVVAAGSSASMLERTPIALANAILAIWGATALIHLIRVVRGLVQLAQLTRAARPIETASDSAFPVLESALVHTPSASFLGQAVLVPPSFSDLPEYWRRAVITHETIHLQRRHGHAIVFEEIVRSLFWFHPLMKRLVLRVRNTREEVVDADTVEALGNHAQYRELLIALATRSRSLAPAVSGVDSLCARLQSLKSLENRIMPNLPFARVLCAALSMFGVTVSAFAITSSTAPEAAAQEKVEGKEMPSAERIKVGNVNPIYPAEFKQKKVSALVLLEVVINPEGAVTAVSPIKTDRTAKVDPAFVKASIEAVRQWTYQPAEKTSKMTITINFRSN